MLPMCRQWRPSAATRLLHTSHSTSSPHINTKNIIRHYSGAGEEYFRMQKMHEGLKDVEELYAKYRMDRFTEHSQVDDMLRKGLLTETFANNLREEIDVRKEAGKAAAHWKRVFWFIGMPLIGLGAYNAYLLETEEWKHWEEHPPRTYPYPHLHIFNKKFPWGDGTKTAFHHENNELMEVEK